MSDPNYAHEFTPNRKGLCQQTVSGKMCHLGKEALVHVKWQAKKLEEEREVDAGFDELREIKQKAEYLKSKWSDQSETSDLCELITRLADELIREKQNRLNGEQS